MKIRIITNGTKYRIQEKNIFGWKTLVSKKETPYGLFEELIEFENEESIAKFILKRYGTSVKIDDHWVPIGIDINKYKKEVFKWKSV